MALRSQSAGVPGPLRSKLLVGLDRGGGVRTRAFRVTSSLLASQPPTNLQGFREVVSPCGRSNLLTLVSGSGPDSSGTSRSVGLVPGSRPELGIDALIEGSGVGIEAYGSFPLTGRGSRAAPFRWDAAASLGSPDLTRCIGPRRPAFRTCFAMRSTTKRWRTRPTTIEATQRLKYHAGSCEGRPTQRRCCCSARIAAMPERVAHMPCEGARSASALPRRA